MAQRPNVAERWDDMKNFIKHIANRKPNQRNSIRLEMSKGTLELVIRVSEYINDNFMASDFFTLGDVGSEEFSKFLLFLKQAQEDMNADGNTLCISFDWEDHHTFDRVLWYGGNFGDDIEELEAWYDDICDIVEHL